MNSKGLTRRSWAIARVFLASAIRCKVVGAVLSIEPAVQVMFDTTTNRFYQVEAASSVAPDQWLPVGPTHWGRGAPLMQSVPNALWPHAFFRTREFDLTNKLVAYFPMDGVVAKDRGGFNQKLYVTDFMPNRFGAANHAGLNVVNSLNPSGIFATLSRFGEGTNDFTISVWVMGTFATATTANFGRIFTMAHGLFLYGTNNTIRFGPSDVTKPLIVSGPAQFESNRWHNAQLVRSNSIFALYWDGNFLGDSGVTRIGFGDYFDVELGPKAGGGADEARFYNRALSPDELGALYRLADH
jgi:hypothetical protein